MNDPVSRVLDLSQKLQELRERVQRLDAERGALLQEIAVCMEQLASAAGREIMPPPNSTMTERVIWALRRHPDRPMAPMDVAGMLDIRKESELTNLRVLMSRMGRDGRVRRVAHGRYMAIS